MKVNTVFLAAQTGELPITFLNFQAQENNNLSWLINSSYIIELLYT